MKKSDALPNKHLLVYANSQTNSSNSKRGCVSAAGLTRSIASISKANSPRASGSNNCSTRTVRSGDRVARRLRSVRWRCARRGCRDCCWRVEGREVVVVANDATVKAGSWWPETIKKILRAQEIAMRSRVPIIYLVDSAGVNLPYQGGVFPGQYGASRIFYYNSIMRRYLKVPQISAVMGPCIAGGAYLPALSDVIIMVEGTSFMGLGGANLVKGATGQTIDNETLGGARTHNEISGVAHYRVADDEACIEKIREFVSELPKPNVDSVSRTSRRAACVPADELYDIIPEDHRQPYDVRKLLECLLDDGHLDEFQADYAKEMITGHARIRGIQVGVIANHRGMVRMPGGKPPRFGGIIYTESAEKVAYFIETCNRHQTPLLFVQDVSGFHGWTRRRALGNHSRGREICRSDGDRDSCRRSC